MVQCGYAKGYISELVVSRTNLLICDMAKGLVK